MKKLFTLLFAIVASVGTIFAESGTCGDNLTWNLTNGALTISGTGDMADWYWNNFAPWYSYRENITSVTIGNSVTSIGEWAFRECSGLTSVTIGNSVTSIGELAFFECPSLTSVIIPNSVTNIGKDAFEGCSALTSVTISNSVTSIGDGTFWNCFNLMSVTIPNSVTSIGYAAFWDCRGLTSVTIPNSVTSIGNHAFYNCRSLTSIEIPNSVTSIGNSAFIYCSSLTSIEIPNSVTSIGKATFRGCRGLTSVAIPNSIANIGEEAFRDCSGLTSITCEAVTPPTCDGSDVFNNVNKSIPLYVPAQSIAAYQAANVWRDFTNILPIEGDEPTGNECSDSKILAWEPVEQQADMDLWYVLKTTDGSSNPIIPDTCDVRIKISNISDENANVFADVYVECSEPALKAESYILQPFASDSFDIDRDMLERFGWPPMIYNVTSNQNISIQAELIPDMPRDTLRDTIVAYVCQGDMFEDTIPYNWKIIDMVDHSMTWKDTVEFRDGLQMKDSIITFLLHPLIMPEPLSIEEMRGIGAAPLLVQGMQLYVDESNARLTEYYRDLGNTVDTIVRIDTAYWAKPIYYADGNLNVKKEAPLDLSKYYSKNDYTDTLLLVVRSEECSFIMRIEYIFPIEGYKYVFRNDTICPPDPYYNPDTLTSIVLDTLGLPRWVDTISIYYSMLQPALYSQDEISLLPFVANGQPIDTTFTLSALKQQFADDATNLTARVTNIKWQVLEGDVWMDMPYVVSQTATEIHMRYIVETECAIRDTSMNIILPIEGIHYSTIADLYNMAQDSAFTLGAFDVVYVPDFQNGSNMYIKDETGSMVIYKVGYGLQAGDHVEAGLQGKISIYNGICEIIPISQKSDLTVTAGEAPAPMEATEVPSLTNVSQFVVYKNVSFATDTAFVEGRRHAVNGTWNGQQVKFYNQYYIGATLSASKTYNITAVNAIYVTNPEAYPLAVEEVTTDTLEPCLIASGTCGTNLTWELSCDSVLTISGTGAMVDNPSWSPYVSLIKAVIMPEGLTIIGRNAFAECVNLESAHIPESVTAIGPAAFYNCSALTSINMPDSVRMLGHKAFVGCESLTEPVYNAHIFGFMPRNYCGAYSIPEGIVSVAAYAFCGIASATCSGLTEITIPSSVKRLGVEAFGLLFLRKITCLAVTPPTCDSTTFEWYLEETGITVKVDRSIPVYVPAESVDAYKAADVWKEFFNILPIGGTIEPQDSIYDVVYLDQAGMQIDAEAITLHLPVSPEIEGFTFLKWQVVAGDLENGIYIQAVYTANEPTNAPEVYTNPANKAQKLIRNGQVYILTEDKIYSVTGQKVR